MQAPVKIVVRFEGIDRLQRSAVERNGGRIVRSRLERLQVG